MKSYKKMAEELKGNQHKIDKNKNGKIDAHDFKLLRKEDTNESYDFNRAALAKQRLMNLKKSGRAVRGASIANLMRAAGIREEELTDEDIGQLDEVLTKDAKAADWIKDFVHSTNPKFEGKSKKERINMALGAYYGKQREKDSRIEEETDTSEKNEMAETQLHFIKYAAEEILEYIKMGGEIEEWYQNKLSKVQSEVESLHSYIEGESRRTGMKEEVELEESNIVTVAGSRDIRPGTKHSHTVIKDHGVHNYATGAQHKVFTVKRPNGFHGVLVTDKDKTQVLGQTHRNHSKEEALKIADHYVKHGQVGMSKHAPWYIGGDKIVKEEVEELDELNKSTLASYAKKATHSARMNQSIGKDFEKQADKSRKPGMKDAAQSLADKYKSKSRSREAGVGKAIDRLAKEEFELEEAKIGKPVNVDKIHSAGQEPHEEKFETYKKKTVKEEFDEDGNITYAKISFKDFTETILEGRAQYMVKATHNTTGRTKVTTYVADKEETQDDVHSRAQRDHKPSGFSIDSIRRKDVEAHGEGDEEETSSTTQKRGRGRPAGAKSGARGPRIK